MVRRLAGYWRWRWLDLCGTLCWNCEYFCICDSSSGKKNMADCSQNYVNVIVTSAGHEETYTERRFRRDITIADLKVSQWICRS
jgi:hypothetical protein